MKRTISSLAMSSILLLGLSVTVNAGNPGTGFEKSNEQGSTNGQPFHTLQTHLETLRTDFTAAISDLQRQINDLNDSQADQDVLIGQLQNAVSILGDRITELDTSTSTDITNLQAALEAQGVFLTQLIVTLTKRVTDLEARVATNEGDIIAIILADEATQKLISTIQTQISNLESQVSTNTGDISTLNTQITTLNETLVTVKADLALKQNRVDGVCGVGSAIREIKADGSVTCEKDDTGAGVGTFHTVARTVSATIPNALIFVGSRAVEATCPSGYRATGGGYIIGSNKNDPRLVWVNYNAANTGSSWRVNALNDNLLGTSVLKVRVQCGKIIP